MVLVNNHWMDLHTGVVHVETNTVKQVDNVRASRLKLSLRFLMILTKNVLNAIKSSMLKNLIKINAVGSVARLIVFLVLRFIKKNIENLNLTIWKLLVRGLNVIETKTENIGVVFIASINLIVSILSKLSPMARLLSNSCVNYMPLNIVIGAKNRFLKINEPQNMLFLLSRKGYMAYPI